MILLFKFKMYESNLGGSRLPSSIADRIATSGFTFNPCIKTHDSESRGQEEAGRTRRTSVLFTGSTALN